MLPPFNGVDELFHYDVVVKYAHGHMPYRLMAERLSSETKEAVVLYGTGISLPGPGRVLLHNSPEYLNPGDVRLRVGMDLGTIRR